METRKAMGERILHFDIGGEAANHLARLGGRAFTEREGARWIRGDSGQASDFVVAKHFMWLYKNRPPRAKQNRYCVMGNCNESESFQIASTSDSLPVVMRGIIGMFNAGKGTKWRQFRLDTVQGRAYVTLEGLLGYIREVDNIPIGERSLEAVLKSILRTSAPRVQNHRNYYELNIPQVLEFATHWGASCPRLRELLEMQKDHLR